jgi:hypothetical protein
VLKNEKRALAVACDRGGFVVELFSDKLGGGLHGHHATPKILVFVQKRTWLDVALDVVEGPRPDLDG